jgi:dolichyl-phosphooligosaccharide-protein glycotransferase
MSDDDKLEFSFDKFKNFFKKDNFKIFSNSKLIILLLILIPMLFSGLIRVQPMNLPVVDAWAEQSVYSNIKSNIFNDISREFPMMSDQDKLQKTEADLKTFIANNQKLIQPKVKEQSYAIKQRLKNEAGYTYLLAIDPYHYYRRIFNVIDHGFEGDAIIDGQEMDLYQLAPNGMPIESKNLHSYFQAYWIKFMRIFGINDDMGAVSLFPVFLSVLAVIPAFFIGKRFAGKMGGFVSAFIVAVASPFVSRTAAGFADTDPYNVLFPLLAAWFVIESVSQKKLIHKIIYASLAGFTIGIFSILWLWWFIFDLILAALIGYIIFELIKIFVFKTTKFTKKLKEVIIADGVFILTSGIFVSLFYGFQKFLTEPFMQPYRTYFLKSVATFKIWPNVYTTVAEQNSLSINSLMTMMGGSIYFFLAMFGIFLTAFSLKKLSKRDGISVGIGGVWFLLLTLLKPANAFVFLFLFVLPFIIRYVSLWYTKEEFNLSFSLLIFAWFTSMFYASVQGVRYTLLLVPPFAIGIGIFAGFVYSNFSKFLHKSLDIKVKYLKAMAVILIGLILIQPMLGGINTGKHEVPQMNDAWFNTLTRIDQEAAPNAIINSWWDFGHWFKAIGNRRVTFDGASQNTPMAHWIGKSLLSNNEAETVAILRMLDCGSNNAFDEIDEEINNTAKSVKIINKIILLEREEALLELLNLGFTEDKANRVLSETHCDAPENYYITSEDMVGKGGVWAHFGSWDFDRAMIFRDVKKLSSGEAIKLMMEDYNLSESTADRYYYEIQQTEADNWIAPWPTYGSGKVRCTEQANQTLICPNQINTPAGKQVVPFTVDLTTMDAYIDTTEGRIYPSTFLFPTKEGYGERVSNESNDLSLVFLPEANGFYSMITTPILAKSTFTKLFFFRGHGMNCFEPFTDETQFTGQKILTWKVDWSCNTSISYGAE